MRDLFLSHSSTDKSVVRKIAADVQAQQGADGEPLTVWFDEAEIQAGQSIPGAVNAGLEASKFFALLMSPAYFQSGSGWTDAEWHSIVHIDPDNRRRRILPILIADCPKIPPLLRHLRMIDMRETRYAEGFRELLSILRRDVQPKAFLHRGQLVLAGRQVAVETVIAERAAIDAEPAAVTELLSCNLLPVERLPSFVYLAPIAASLRELRSNGTSVVPTKATLKELIVKSQLDAGKDSFVPAFRKIGEEIVTFHDLEAEDSVFTQVIEHDSVSRERTEEWLLDPDDRRVITSLLNMAVSRHVHRLGLRQDDRKQQRFFFAPNKGEPLIWTWRPFRKLSQREVAGRRQGSAREFWRHTAAYLTITFLGNRFYLKIEPTWVFTTDGEQIMRGPEVGRLAVQWSGAERNLALLYHVRFWTHVLRRQPGPISIRAGDQTMEFSSRPAFVRLAFGIPGDTRDLDHGLDTWAERIESVEDQAIEAVLEQRLSPKADEKDSPTNEVDDRQLDLDEESPDE